MGGNGLIWFTAETAGRLGGHKQGHEPSRSTEWGGGRLLTDWRAIRSSRTSLSLQNIYLFIYLFSYYIH